MKINGIFILPPIVIYNLEFDKDISEFLYYYGALEIDRIIPNCDKYDTDKYVKKYMKQYGLNNIRGGSYNNLKLTSFEKEFIQKELDYIDIDDNKYNDKNKKKIDIEYYEDKLRKIKNNGYWILIKPEENPDSRLPSFLQIKYIQNMTNHHIFQMNLILKI